MRSVSGFYGKKVSFIVDADIRSFFDAISQQWLIRFLEHRIGASCAPRPGRNPIREPEEVLLVDRVQQRDHSPLDASSA